MPTPPTFLPAVCFVLAAFAAIADEGSDREALLVEIEYLNETGYVGAAGIQIAAAPLIVEFYERRSFAPAWRDLDQVGELLQEIRASHAEGLNPADYHLETVQTGVAQLRADPEITSRERAVIELVLTDSLIRLGYHKLFGKVNPYSLDSNWNFRRELDFADPAAVVQDAIDSPSLAEALQALAPRGWLYRDLLAALADYRDIAARGGWPQIPGGQTLRPGDSDWRVPLIAARLVVTGDLEPGENLEAASAYTDRLVAAVRHFQGRHGIEVDGVVGPNTIRAMNVPVEQRVRQLEISLERARWVTNDLEDDLVLVASTCGASRA